MKNKLVFVDAETDGLYGGFLTVALMATDFSGQEIERAYYGIRNDKINITDSWTTEYVLSILGEYQSCEDERELLEKVWTFWVKYADDAYAIADVAFPVESRLWAKCVSVDEQKRKRMAPYPLLDLSSLLLARGYDPLVERKSILQKIPKGIMHNAMYDVEVSVMIWRERIM